MSSGAKIPVTDNVVGSTVWNVTAHRCIGGTLPSAVGTWSTTCNCICSGAAPPLPVRGELPRGAEGRQHKMQPADDVAFLLPIYCFHVASVTDLRVWPVCSYQPRVVCGSWTIRLAFALTHSWLLFYSDLGFAWFMDKLLSGLTSHLAMQEPLLLSFLKRRCYWPHFLTLPGSGVQVLLGNFI